MIVRHYIACGTCTQAHTLRIQVGHQPYQEHTFHCVGCEEEIVVGMKCNAQDATVEVVEIKNCERGESEGHIINLSPDFPIPKHERHLDLAFPSHNFIHQIASAQSNLGINYPEFSSIEEARAWSLQHKGPNELWSTVKKGWSLTQKGRLELAATTFGEYRKGLFSDPPELQYVLFDFCSRLLLPSRYSLFKDSAELCESTARQHTTEFRRFKDHYRTEIRDDNLERYFEVFKQYFACFSDFSQTLMHRQHDIKLPDDYEASSYAFDKTKLFYGNAFEALTSNVAVLACLGNIIKGRPFDKFEQMDLKKYLSINKANRCNPFKDVVQFSAICRPIDSTTRNASHHVGMKLVDRGRTIQYRSGGDGGLRTMSYVTYIDACNDIMLSCCALLAIELAIAF